MNLRFSFGSLGLLLAGNLLGADGSSGTDVAQARARAEFEATITPADRAAMRDFTLEYRDKNELDVPELRFKQSSGSRSYEQYKVWPTRRIELPVVNGHRVMRFAPYELTCIGHDGSFLDCTFSICRRLQAIPDLEAYDKFQQYSLAATLWYIQAASSERK